MTYISMVINLQGETLPSLDKLDLRWEIHDLIEGCKIGEVIGSGGGCGQMDIGVEVADVEVAKSQLRAIANEYELKTLKSTFIRTRRENLCMIVSQANR